jgi:uncharacterized protein YydD (DUF2326 family)
MFIKRLTISGDNGEIRNLTFHKGLNLIVDKTVTSDDASRTGNNVGKTTVLRLIDFCLGNSADSLYKDPENKSEVNHEVKDFLTSQRVLITLELVDNLDAPGRRVVIERNFLQRKERVYTINGESVGSKKEEIAEALLKYIFPDVKVAKPTFRQLVSHNIRYEEYRLNSTLKTLMYGSDEDYETLYLFMFGCDYDQGEARTRILAKREREETFKRRLEKVQTKGAYKVALDVIEGDIEKLEKRKRELNINPNLEQQVERLNRVKQELNSVLGSLSALTIRKSVIDEALSDIQGRKFDDNLDAVAAIYKQASAFIPNLQKSFEDLVSYHNQMLENKKEFLSSELPNIEGSISRYQKQVDELRREELELSAEITSSDTFADLEEVIGMLNALFQKKGSYEAAITSITEVENNIAELNRELEGIDSNLFSEGFQQQIDSQLGKFNGIFSSFSNRLYGEQYAIKCDPDTKRGKRVYKFATIDVNFSSGKKHGEISCFDLAYTKFADIEGIACLHFLLNDKKELMHGNQLNEIAKIANEENIQFVASILEDKLTDELRDQKYYVVELEENNKLFRF